MSIKKKQIRKIVPLLLIFLWAGCASKRQEVQIKPQSPPSDKQKAAASITATPPPYCLESLAEEKAFLLENAEVLNECALDYARNGEWELALFFVEESLSLLDSATGPNRNDPEIRDTYQDISRNLDRFRVLALNSNQEISLPNIEITHDPDSFLDELAEMDLYAIEIPPDLKDKVDEDLQNARFSIPITLNKEVLQFLEYYQNKARNTTQQAMDRSSVYIEEIKRIFEDEGIPEELIYMAHVESLFKYNAYSRARARGMWQFMTGTAKLYGLNVNWWVDERLDPIKSTEVAAKYLTYLFSEFNDWYLAMAAYNVGPGRIKRILQRHGEMDYWTMMRRRLIPRETRNHVPATIAAIIIYNNPALYGFTSSPAAPPQTEPFSVDYQVDLGVVAESIGFTLEDLRDLNPALQRGVTPFEPKKYTLNIPAGYGAELKEALAELPPSERIRLRHHRVSSGETLSLIASRYGVSIRAIADTNQLRNIHRLSIGQDLIIPVMEPKSISGEEARKIAASSGVHTVRKGDSLYRIARIYGIKLQNLFDWNSLGPDSRIYPGQQIMVSPR